MIARLFAFLLLIYVLGYAFFVVALPQPAGEERTDGIVVLTGGPGRIERGLELIRRGVAQRMLISGVERTVRQHELAAAHRVDERVFECCIDLGQESVDTRSNADEVARWLEARRFRSIRLITTDWHMPRARYEIRRRAPDGLTILNDAVRSNPSFRQLFVEYNKYLLNRAADLVGI